MKRDCKPLLTNHGNGWLVLATLHEHLYAETIEYSDHKSIVGQDLECQEVVDLHRVSNGSPP